MKRNLHIQVSDPGVPFAWTNGALWLGLCRGPTSWANRSWFLMFWKMFRGEIQEVANFCQVWDFWLRTVRVLLTVAAGVGESNAGWQICQVGIEQSAWGQPFVFFSSCITNSSSLQKQDYLVHPPEVKAAAKQVMAGGLTNRWLHAGWETERKSIELPQGLKCYCDLQWMLGHL